MKGLKVALVSFLVLSVVVTFVQADIINVPGDYPTIQEGINAAVDGDTVLVASGTYTGPNNKNLDFQGKDIIVESENGPASTIIDCQGTGRGVYFHSGETAESVLSGFTIKNGSIKIANDLGGGGICCENSSPIIEFNIIELNSSGWAGGGIFCNGASPIIRHNLITDNSAKWGAGIACINSSSPTIADNDITDNDAEPFDGGGIYFRDSSPTIVSNIIDGNLVHSRLPGGWGGGGIFCVNSSSVMENNIITNNSADDSITGQGGAIRCLSSTLTIINNTISGNSARFGDGIACRSGASVTILNTILWGNGTEEIDDDGSSSISVTYSDVQGGWPGTGNINADPAFTSDYHLNNSSPCIGKGIMTPGVPTQDFEGDPRPNPAGSQPDIGADENPLAKPSS